MSHLSIELQISLASCTGINGELRGLVHDATRGLQAGSKGLHLSRGKRGGLGWRLEEGLLAPSQAGVRELGPHLVREAIGWGWLDVGNEGRVSDVFIIADDMHGILPRLRGPVPHVAGAISLVVTLDLGL